MNEQLMDLLEYRVVCGALVTTLDGLVVAHAGMTPEDAEALAASSSVQSDSEPYSSETTRGGMVHALSGSDMRLIVLADASAPRSSIVELMRQQLDRLEASLGA